MEVMQGVISSTAAKINSVCDAINVTQSQHTQPISSTEEDPALILIKSSLKNVPSNMKIKCLSEIMTILDKYSDMSE